jgi:hypothetical protein
MCYSPCTELSQASRLDLYSNLASFFTDSYFGCGYVDMDVELQGLPLGKRQIHSRRPSRMSVLGAERALCFLDDESKVVYRCHRNPRYQSTLLSTPHESQGFHRTEAEMQSRSVAGLENGLPLRSTIQEWTPLPPKRQHFYGRLPFPEEDNRDTPRYLAMLRPRQSSGISKI